MSIARFCLPIVMVGALALAGCMSGPMQRSGPVAVQPTGVEGQWVFAGDGSVSTLSGGRFTTVSGDTNSRLSEGNYTFIDSRTIAMNGTSLIRQTPVAFNCLLATPNQLNCTTSSGNNITLVRRTVS